MFCVISKLPNNTVWDTVSLHRSWEHTTRLGKAIGKCRHLEREGKCLLRRAGDRKGHLTHQAQQHQPCWCSAGHVWFGAALGKNQPSLFLLGKPRGFRTR